jgi:Spy/CpxP family protein refolding chaperone
MDDIRRQTDERLQQVLTPEQWQRFQQLKQDMRGRRRGKREDK